MRCGEVPILKVANFGYGIRCNLTETPSKSLAKEYAPYGPGGSSHTYLDGSSGWLDHDSKGLTFEHYPDHQKVLLRWDRVEKYIDLMIQSDRYLSDKERRSIDFPLELNAASAAEYTALKAQHPDTLVGFEAGGNFMFYGEDAAKVAKVLNSALFTRETALGEVQVTGFPPSLWARKSKELWSAGNDVYLAGLNEDGTHHQTKHLHKEDYLPIGSIINMDGRKFRIDGVDFDPPPRNSRCFPSMWAGAVWQMPLLRIRITGQRVCRTERADSEDEYAAARSSTLNAHYTSPVVIRSIWRCRGAHGFQQR